MYSAKLSETPLYSRRFSAEFMPKIGGAHFQPGQKSTKPEREHIGEMNSATIGLGALWKRTLNEPNAFILDVLAWKLPSSDRIVVYACCCPAPRSTVEYELASYKVRSAWRTDVYAHPRNVDDWIEFANDYGRGAHVIVAPDSVGEWGRQ